MEIDLDKYKDAFANNVIGFMNGKSIIQFSKENELSPITVNNWIHKRTWPRRKHLIFLANKFDCTIDYLLGLEK